MKQLFICFLSIALGSTCFAQSDSEKRTEIRNITLSSAVTSIVVNDGVNVVLIDEETNDLFIEGKNGFLKPVDIKFENGELTISCTNTEAGKPMAVFVSARYLKEITVNGSSIVGSYQIIQNKGLNVLINGDCKLMIRTAGPVNVIATEDYTFTYKSAKIKY